MEISIYDHCKCTLDWVPNKDKTRVGQTFRADIESSLYSGRVTVIVIEHIADNSFDENYFLEVSQLGFNNKSGYGNGETISEAIKQALQRWS